MENGLNRAFSVPENNFWETFLGKIWENLFLGIRKSVFGKFLGKTERILKNVEEIVHERERLYKRLNEIQKNSNDEIKFYKSKSNFIFGRTKNKEKLKKALEDKGILIRYFEDDSFRISVGSPLENDFIVNIIGNNMCEVREKCEENISN